MLSNQRATDSRSSDWHQTTWNGAPVSRSNLIRHFAECLDHTSLLEIRFHDFSHHKAASIMFKHNISVFTASRIRGHSKPSIPLDIYSHLIPGMQSKVV